ncbi:GAF domain-containing protein [bacterium]|nr:GAF domain-containing protein [bacterium]
MNSKQALSASLLNGIDITISSEASVIEKLTQICQILANRVDYYDWGGFYLTDPQKKDELFLGPYVGAPTDHVRIPFGKGICGQAAEAKETVTIQDVTAEKNYLSCSIHVKSEIVVPILRSGSVLGELDIDSHQTGPFSEEDESFLKKICDTIAEKLDLDHVETEY